VAGYLLRDRDAVHGGDFVPRARCLGIQTLLSPVRAPRANAVAERVIGTLRREYLDHLIIVNARRRRAILAEFVRRYTPERPHRARRLETPIPATRPSLGPIRSRAVLRGLQHVHDRAA
jgi:putative transposase